MADDPPIRKSPDGMEIAFCYGTSRFPPQFTSDTDINDYQHLIANPPGIVIPNGSAARLVDFPPGYVSPMHKSISLNYNFVVQGEVEMILDSGETRRLLPGDMAVQRAVNHAWRNVSETEWARITAFVVPAIEAEGTGESKSST
jgi:quercetin dioxygenase-like cupin family protein